MEGLSFVRVKRSVGRGRGGKPAATHLLYCQFAQLGNGGVELDAVDEAHGSFTRRSTLILVAGRRRPPNEVTD